MTDRRNRGGHCSGSDRWLCSASRVGTEVRFLSLGCIFCHLKINLRRYFSLFGWRDLITEVNEPNSDFCVSSAGGALQKAVGSLGCWDWRGRSMAVVGHFSSVIFPLCLSRR